MDVSPVLTIEQPPSSNGSIRRNCAADDDSFSLVSRAEICYNIIVKLYISDIRELFDLSGVELLDEERRSRLYRYRQQEDRMRCLAAGLMLRCVFGKQAAARLSFSRFGKPTMPGGPDFNLSHSGDKVVLLTDEQAVGVDIERIEPYSRAVAQKVFTMSERAWLAQQSTDKAFFQLWTGKEAVMKALGLGFQLPPESFEICPDMSAPNPIGGRNWYLHWIEIENYMICTATEQPHVPEGPILLAGWELLQS